MSRHNRPELEVPDRTRETQLRNEVADLGKKVGTLSRQNDLLRKDLAEAREVARELRDQADHSTQPNADDQTRIRALEDELRRQIDANNEFLVDCSETVRQETTRLKGQLEELSLDRDAALERADTAENQLNLLCRSQRTMLERAENAESELASLRLNQQAMFERLESLEKQLILVERDRDAALERADVAEKQRNALRQAKTTASAQTSKENSPVEAKSALHTFLQQDRSKTSTPLALRRDNAMVGHGLLTPQTAVRPTVDIMAALSERSASSLKRELEHLQQRFDDLVAENTLMKDRIRQDHRKWKGFTRSVIRGEGSPRKSVKCMKLLHQHGLEFMHDGDEEEAAVTPKTQNIVQAPEASGSGLSPPSTHAEAALTVNFEMGSKHQNDIDPSRPPSPPAHHLPSPSTSPSRSQPPDGSQTEDEDEDVVAPPKQPSPVRDEYLAISRDTLSIRRSASTSDIPLSSTPSLSNTPSARRVGSRQSQDTPQILVPDSSPIGPRQVDSDASFLEFRSRPISATSQRTRSHSSPPESPTKPPTKRKLEALDDGDEIPTKPAVTETREQRAERLRQLGKQPHADYVSQYKQYKGHGRYKTSVPKAGEENVNALFEINRDRNDGLAHQFDEVVRDKNKRQRLDGGDCECCREYYAAIGPMPPRLQPPLWKSPSKDAERSARPCLNALNAPADDDTAEIEQHKKEISRHRHAWAAPSTPPDYWLIGFPDTQRAEDINRRAAEMHAQKRARIEKEANQPNGKYKKK